MVLRNKKKKKKERIPDQKNMYSSKTCLSQEKTNKQANKIKLASQMQSSQ